MTLPFKITSPCNQDWDSMTGNDRIRFCSHCQKSVHHLSAMSQKQINRLVARSKGQFCVRYSDVEPQPTKLYRIGKRVSRLAAGAFTASLSISSALAGNPPTQSSSSLIITSSVQLPADAPSDLETGSIQGKVFDPNNGF